LARFVARKAAQLRIFADERVRVLRATIHLDFHKVSHEFQFVELLPKLVLVLVEVGSIPLVFEKSRQVCSPKFLA
jgi:hypothetical protein